jgi:NADH:ubiquinone oxidoreductase subunit F (NADH-binding)
MVIFKLRDQKPASFIARQCLPQEAIEKLEMHLCEAVNAGLLGDGVLEIGIDLAVTVWVEKPATPDEPDVIG